jgi:hypothetical protein
MLAVCMAVGAALRRRVRAVAPERRARALPWGLLGSFAIAFAATWAGTGHAPAPRYWAPVAPAATIVLGGILHRLLGLHGTARTRAHMILEIAIAGLVLGSTVLMGRARTGAAAWTADDLERMAPVLYADGRSYRDLFQHVRGPDAFALVTQLAPYGPPPSRAREPIRDDLLVLKVAREPALARRARGWTVVDLDARHVAVLRRGHSWLDLSNLDVCIERAGAQPRCAHGSLADDDPDRGAAGGFSQRAYPGIEALRRAFAPAELAHMAPFRWTVSAAIHTGPDEPPHDVWMADRTIDWEVVEVEGVSTSEPLPAKRVRLASGAGSGRIVFAAHIAAGEAGRFVPWLPCIVETEAGEDALRALAAGVLP